MKAPLSTTTSTNRLLRVSLVAITLTSAAAFVPRTAHHHHPSSNAGLLNRASLSKLTEPSSTALHAKSKKNSWFLSSQSASNQSMTYALPKNAGATFLLGTPAAALVWEILSTPPTPNPFVVGEILTDLSHVFLDLITLWGPNAVMVRLFAVIGRVLSVLADYVPDGTMNPEEAIFQGFMLVVACTGLFQILLPQMLSQFLAPKPTLRDGKAYTAWGRPAGMSWDQYKALTVSALEWKELDPDEVLNTTGEDDSKNGTTLYWLYRGEAQVQRGPARHKNKSQVIRRSSNNARLRQLDGAQKVDLVSFQTFSSEAEKPTTIRAGPLGATLLACDMDRLKTLMRHDSSLRDVWKVLLWQGLQDQLADAYRDETA